MDEVKARQMEWFRFSDDFEDPWCLWHQKGPLRLRQKQLPELLDVILRISIDPQDLDIQWLSCASLAMIISTIYQPYVGIKTINFGGIELR